MSRVTFSILAGMLTLGLVAVLVVASWTTDWTTENRRIATLSAGVTSPDVSFASAREAVAFRGESELPIPTPEAAASKAAAPAEAESTASSNLRSALAAMKGRFDRELASGSGDPAVTAFDLIGLVIVAELDEAGRYWTVAPDEKVEIVGVSVPPGERRIRFRDRVYCFGEMEYPDYQFVGDVVLRNADRVEAAKGANVPLEGGALESLSLDVVGRVNEMCDRVLSNQG